MYTENDEDQQRDPANDPRSKRRDQVRKAQRTYRARKEEYVNSLEKQIVQLRANEGKLMRETKKLYTEIHMLRTILAQNGLAAPPIIEETEPSLTPITPESPYTDPLLIVKTNHAKGQRLAILDTQVGHAHTRPGEQLPSPGSSSDGATAYTPIDSHLVSSPPNDHQSPPGPNCLANADLTTLGTEFILTLESPCLGHIHNAKEPDAPTGHALMASATLIYPEPTPMSTDSGAGWKAPPEIIQRLLTLSSQLALKDELTPVQAWTLIQQHPDFGKIEDYRLKTLTEKLLKHVRCYGFGAVVDHATLENLVFEVFTAARVFEAPYNLYKPISNHYCTPP